MRIHTRALEGCVENLAFDDSVESNAIIWGSLASKWEDTNRPYLLRRINRDNFRENGAGALAEVDEPVKWLHPRQPE